MTPAPLPIPPELHGRSFHASEALAAGVTRNMLGGARFERLHQGVHTVRASRPQRPSKLNAQVEALAREYSPLLRTGEAFSHTTALLISGAPLRTSADLHVTSAYPLAQARGRGIRGHRTRIPFEALSSRPGLRSVPSELALAQCALMLRFHELVVAIDHLICPRRRGGSWVSILDHERLREYLARTALPGIERVRAACEVARVGAESRYETLMHFELARMGVDTLDLQVDIYDAERSWIGRFDSVDRIARKIVEFDGEQHRTDRSQYLKDEIRLERVRQEGYRVLRLHREDFTRELLEHTRAELCEFLAVSPRSLPRRLARLFIEST